MLNKILESTPNGMPNSISDTMSKIVPDTVSNLMVKNVGTHVK